MQIFGLPQSLTTHNLPTFFPDTYYGKKVRVIIQCIKDIAKRIFAGFYSWIPFVDKGIKLPDDAEAWKILAKLRSISKVEWFKIRGLEEPIPKSFLGIKGSLSSLKEEKEIKFAGGETYYLNGFVKKSLLEALRDLSDFWDDKKVNNPLSFEGISVQQFKVLVKLVSDCCLQLKEVEILGERQFFPHIRQDNVISLLVVANYLGINQLKKACDGFLKNLINEKDSLQTNAAFLSQLSEDPTWFKEYLAGPIQSYLESATDLSAALAVVLPLRPQTLRLSSKRIIVSITDEHMKLIGKCTSLRELCLSHQKQISGEGFKHLRHLRSLKTLRVKDTNFKDEYLGYINGLTNLENLILSKNKEITKIEPLKRLNKLKVVKLSFTGISPEEFMHMRGWSFLQVANLAGCNIDLKGLQILSMLPDFETLNLNHCNQIQSTWFDTLADFPALKILKIKEVQTISSVHFVPLARSSTLLALHLFNCSNVDKKQLQGYLKNVKIEGL